MNKDAYFPWLVNEKLFWFIFFQGRGKDCFQNTLENLQHIDFQILDQHMSTLADSKLITWTTQPISTEKYWKKKTLSFCPMTHNDSSYPRNILNFNRKSQYHWPRDFLHRKHQNKFQFVCCCKFFWNLGTGWISWKKSCYRNVGSTGSYLQIRMNRAVQTRAMCTPFATRQIELCKQVCARLHIISFVPHQFAGQPYFCLRQNVKKLRPWALVKADQGRNANDSGKNVTLSARTHFA